jgi:hypothetical protein
MVFEHKRARTLSEALVALEKGIPALALPIAQNVHSVRTGHALTIRNIA